MPEPSPARLFASAAGLLLLALGLTGFLQSSDFGRGVDALLETGTLLGITVNGWVNVLHTVAGALLVLGAATRPRLVAGAVGAALLAVGLLGTLGGAEDGRLVLDRLTVDGAGNTLRTLLGALGVAAAVAPAAGPRSASPEERRQRRTEARERRETRRRERAEALRERRAALRRREDERREEARRRRRESARQDRRRERTPSVSAVDPNRATFDELRQAGLSMDQAARVIESRERQGPFRTADDLDRVDGLTDRIRAELGRGLGS